MLTEKEEQMIAEYEAQIKEYQALLEEAAGEPKAIARVLAGPFIEPDTDKKYYRVSKGKDELIVYQSEDPMFGATPIVGNIDVETEVLIIGQIIAALVPEELKIVIEPPTFDLIGWDEIGGLKSQVAEIREAIEMPLLHASVAEDLGVQPIAGILMYGPPGVGEVKFFLN